MKPEIINGIFALSGTLIGVVGAWLVSKSNNEIHRLTLIVSPISKLLEVGELARSDVKITYKDAEVSGLCAGEVTIQNSGNTAVENIEIEIHAKFGSQLLELEKSNSNFSLPEEFILTEKRNDNSSISMKYLNPKDRISFQYKTTGPNIPEFILRKKGLDVETKHDSVSWIPDIYAEILFEAFEKIPLPGISWYMSLISKPYKLYRESKRKKA